MASQDRRASKSADVEIVGQETVVSRSKNASGSSTEVPSSSVDQAAHGSTNDTVHGTPMYIGGAAEVPNETMAEQKGEPKTLMEHWRTARRGWLAYVKTKDFWIVLVFGQILSLCITGTNTLSGLLANAGVSIPAFQILPNYVLLCLIYTSYTIYRYGFKGWLKLLKKDGWRYFILSFADVQGNYFVVLAYRYTTILQAQLIGIWAVVVVVILSFVFLKVRYAWTQYLGILVAIGGLGILIASDHITGANSFGGNQHVKGDLFALVGATFYGLTNTFEEFLVSKRPLYEVVGQLGLWGIPIAGVQTAIFDRDQWRAAVWTSAVGGYFTGFTLVLSIFYTLAPLMFRMSSAAFFNISLLTANFWGVLIGIEVFGASVHWMYPIAFVLILFGLLIYFLTESVMGEAKKPWLGENQEQGVSGIGTARWRAERKGLRPETEAVTGPGVV